MHCNRCCGSVFTVTGRGALDCRAKAVNEEMKRAATYAIAALAKRPVMRRRTPSAGDLIHLSAAAQQPARTADAPSISSSSTASTDCTVPATNGSSVSCTTCNSDSLHSKNGACSKHIHKHTNSGGKAFSHLRRKSYGEASFYTASEGDGSAPAVFGKQ